MSSQIETAMVHTESFTEVKTTTTSVKKSHSLHRKKSKKEEKNISVKSSSEKVQKKLKHEGNVTKEANPNCQICGKPVYAMERIKAEKHSWHKECFRCKECNKLLNVENFESHMGDVYCKPHFKSLFAPKAVEEDEQEKRKPKKPQMIICESNPTELPPDVVRASSKADLGLEELSNLDVKSRFQMFEHCNQEPEQRKPIEHPLARDKSTTLLAKLAKFKSKGMDIGITDDYLNGIPIEPSSSEEDDDDPDSALRKSYKQTAKREQPVSFCNMSEILGKFESGDVSSKERHDERKQEIQSIRNRLFMGKQAKIKEMYQQSVLQSEQSVTSAEKIAKEFQLDIEKASSIKQKFEKGEIFNDEEHHKPKEIEDQAIFNAGISKKSRSMFKEIDANIMNSGPVICPPKANEPRRKEKPFIPKDVVRADDRIDDVKIETTDISNKFKFFETFQPKEVRKQFRMTPPRDADKIDSPEQEVYRDPTIAREVANGIHDSSIAQQRHTASKMINVFKQLEEDQNKEEVRGPKPLKRFTPPPPGADYHAPSSSEEEYTDEEYSEEYSDEEEENVKKYSAEDEVLKQAQVLAKAKNLRNRFENWNEFEPKLTQSQSVIYEFTNMDGKDESQIESAKSLRNKFESMKNNANVVKTMSTTKVNRFI